MMRRWIKGCQVVRNVMLASLLAASGAVWADSSAADLLRVDAGGQEVVDMRQSIARVAVGNEAVAAIRVISPRQFIVQGKEPGITSLLIWLRGQAKAEERRILVSVPTVGDGSEGGLALKAAGDLRILSGSAPDVATLVAAREGARHLSAGKDAAPLLDRSTVDLGGEVQIDVRVVEFSRKVMNRAGMSFLSNKSGFSFGAYAPGSLSKAQLSNGAITAEASLPVSQALNLLIGSSKNNLLGVVSLLEGNGFARTLAQPTLVAQSGRDADFLAGGEFPVPVPQALGQTTIQYKPYGIRLQVSPTVLASNRIALTVTPEVSDLDFENGITINGVSVPSLTTRRASTSVELGNGESFVIGGLVSQNLMRNINKVPGLGDVPLLGAFFKSVSLAREDKELVFIVTPRLVRPLAAGAELGELPGAAFAKQGTGLMESWLMSDDDFNRSITGLSQ